MLTIRKRGKTYHADWLLGKTHVVRGTLGTRDKGAAVRRKNRLEIALSEGPGSALWPELSKLIPRSTFIRFAEYAGVKELPKPPTWVDLCESFGTHMSQRIAIGKLRESTTERYRQAIREFGAFLSERGLSLLSEIDKPLVEQFKVWRMERIKARKNSRGGTGLALDAAILHRVFSFALENEMVAKNPVRLEGRPGDNAERGAQPFKADELAKLREATGADLLTFLLLRWTGMRGSDAVGLRWEEIDWGAREVNRLTLKRRKRIVLPLHQELLFALEVERDNRNPKPEDRVLLNPATGQALTRPRLYERMLALGRRAGVANAHPHRFRDTFAVDLLARGASPYDVAKLLGDTVETVERHYAPFVRELRERTRHIMETGAGLESALSGVTPASQLKGQIQ